MRSVAPRWVWVTLVVVALASVGASLKTSHDTSQTNEKTNAVNDCLVLFIAENSRVSKARATATSERDVAIDDVVGAFDKVLTGVANLTLKPQADRGAAAQRYRDLLAAYKAESGDYKAASAKVKVERAKNPLPDLPSSCADVLSEPAPGQ